MQKSETVNPEHVRGEMGKLDPSKVTEASLDCTDEDGERLRQRRTARKQWQQNAFTNLTGVPRNPRKLAGEPMTEKQEEIHLKVPHPKIRRDARLLGVLGSLIATHVRTTRKSRPCSPVRGSAIHPSYCWDEERGGGSSDVFVSKESSCDSPSDSQILSQLPVEMEMMSVSEEAMKAQPDVEIGTVSVQRGTKRTSSTWEDCADKINMEVCLDAAGKCRRCDADEDLATVAGVRPEPTQMQECEVFRWRRGYKRSSRETVISTRMFPPSQERDKAQPRTCESRSERSVVARKHQNDDRREARGKPGRSPWSSTPSSRFIDCGQRDVMELSTAAQAVMSSKGTGAVSCFGPSGLPHR